MTVLIARARALPRATLAATLFLLACSIVAFVFVVQRGGLYLPIASPAVSPTVLAASAAPRASETVSASPANAAAQASLPALAVAPTAATHTPVASSGGGTGAQAPSAKPRASAAPSPRATPRATPARTAGGGSSPSAVVGGTPSASRLAVLVTCPGRADCYTYTIRPGDNLWSIAAWFGVPMDRVRTLNPWLGSGQLVVAGQKLVIPTPSR